MKVVIEIPDGTNDEVQMVANSFSLNTERTTFGAVSMLVIKKEDEEMAALHRLGVGGDELPATVHQAVEKSLESMRLS